MTRFVELRIHGVSGTSAEDLLGVKEVTDPPVAGDDFVRFVRPALHSDAVLPDEDGRMDGRLEGMSWGRLTSGSTLLATWLLLLPFALVNLAYWARSWDKPGDPRNAWYGWLVRVLGLSLTSTIVFTIASGSMDLLAWQCVVQDETDCLQVHGWLDVVESWQPGQQLAVAALVPVGAIAFLDVLSRRSALRYEAFHAPRPDGNGSDDPHLASRRMWRGERLVSRLRTLHTSAGLATTTAILALAVRGLDGAGVQTLAYFSLGVALLVLLGCAALASRVVWARWTDDGTRERGWIPVAVLGSAAAGLGLSFVAALLADGVKGPGPVNLPGIIGVGHTITLAQIVLLAVLGLVVAEARDSWHLFGALAPRRDALGISVEPPTPHGLVQPKVALRGFAGWFIATVAVLLGFAYAAGAIFRTAGLLAGSEQAGPCDQCVTFETSPDPAPAFDIAALAVGVFVIGLIALAAVLGVQLWRRKSLIVREVREEYHDELRRLESDAPLDDRDYRIQRAAKARLFAQAVSIDRFAPVLVWACGLGVVAGIYAGLRVLPGAPSGLTDPPGWQSGGASFLRHLGVWTVTAFALGLIALGVLAWRSDRARRLVGIIWDVVSFWPRAGHPLAPPCYAERAVPQLVCRIEYLTTGQRPPGWLVLAGHSQGSVLAVAALSQLKQDDVDVNARIALLTFGSPLLRLYATVFPRLFWPRYLRTLPVAGPDRRWTNLWRPTDPIGGTLHPPLELAADPAETPERGDLRLRDPKRLQMDPETSAYPAIHGHTNYYADSWYAACRTRLLQALRSLLP